MNVNLFTVNPVIPDKMVALVKTFGTTAGPITIWYGWIAHMPEDLFAEANEAHVSQWTYDRIASKAEETGKGIPYDETSRH